MLTDFTKDVPLDWLRKILEEKLTPEAKSRHRKNGLGQADGDTQEASRRTKRAPSKVATNGLATGGTSPFGNSGYNPQGIRIGGKGGNKSAVKVWDQRAYQDYDDTQELGTRNIKVALRRLRHFAREGSAEELDLPDTIRATAANAGYLDIKMVPERHNNVKVLLLHGRGRHHGRAHRAR
jgi:uncharacterized protein with von Willebrand factor type A (vWA) domain